jgi:hypothetical protein
VQTSIQAGRSGRDFEQLIERIGSALRTLQPDLAQLETRAARILEQLRPE